MGSVRRMFIHGLESSGQGFKGQLLRSVYDDLLAPDFPGSFEERMTRLHPMLDGQGPWILVGSSFGGLMAATWTCQHPDQVQRLFLLAPALHYPNFAQAKFGRIDVPTMIVHGTNDTVVPLEVVRSIATRTFSDLTFQQVDDDHQLHETVKGMNWGALLDA